uniref:Homeobox-containing protein 1 n=1 Tax=Chinchilla lanigera TaxID=34839 RepID=A0A8C2VDA9_CHILA
MSHYTDEPRFTIEQIDLLQRLRRTGMTKHEILHALETLDRLDQEHNDKFGRRSSSGGNSYGNSTHNVPASSSTAAASTQTQHSGMPPSPSNSYDTSPQPCTTNQNGRENNERLSTSSGKMSPTRCHANSMAQRSYSFEGSEEDLDVDDKVEELMRRDGSVIKEEIKAFLANRRIPQAVVAQVTGISPSRISHWLLQQGSDLSEQKKRAFYRWFHLEKTNPGATPSMQQAPIPVDDPEWRQTPPPVSAASGTFQLWRRSQFTWRKECLAVVESYFNENQYPDEAKREEIANACSAVIQKPGTSLKVYHWLANRWKEIKRRANIKAAILESHGIEVQSPCGHSNSSNVNRNKHSEQDTCTSHSDHQDPISLAVEMAAVNHTTLALAQQGTNEIKTEALDDD